MTNFNNQTQLLGRLGDRPSLTMLTDGALVARCRIYVADAAGPMEGEENTSSTFRLVAWGALADAFHRDLRRGDRILIRGRLRNHSFRHDGQVHLRTEVHVDHYSRLARRRSLAASEGIVAESSAQTLKNPIQ